jgi:CheY-like chemotaxis protein
MASNSSNQMLLIVDDSHELVDLLAEVAHKACPELRIETASDGFEALGKITEALPSMMIVGVMMPGCPFRQPRTLNPFLSERSPALRPRAPLL